MNLPNLKNPPIEEVVCGFVYDPLDIDAVDFSLYQQERVEDYPDYEFRSPLFDAGRMVSKGFPVRMWLVSEDEHLVVQLQHDRFYVNWRNRGKSYPRFSDFDARPGLRTIALNEFERWTKFLANRGVTCSLSRMELTKIDLLRVGVDFDVVSDVAGWFKLNSLTHIPGMASDHCEFLIQESTDIDVSRRISCVLNNSIFRLETQATFRQEENEDLQTSFSRANGRLNDVFKNLLTAEGLKRFGGIVSEENK